MKTILITGSNSGIGKAAALRLAKSGHRIIMLCRNSEKSVQAHLEIVSLSGNKDVFLIHVDLSNPQSILSAVEEIKKEFPVVDVLINNAGLYKLKRQEADNGVEMTFAVNFIAVFILSQMLLENLQAGGDSRIVNVVSEHYKKGEIDLDNLLLQNGYNAGKAYANSKLAAVLYTAELAKRMEKKGITVNAMHPGVLATNSFRDYPLFVMKFINMFLEKPEVGGERIAYLATSDDVIGITGKYFYKTEEREMNLSGDVEGTTAKLWQIAEKYIPSNRTSKEVTHI